MAELINSGKETPQEEIDAQETPEQETDETRRMAMEAKLRNLLDGIDTQLNKIRTPEENQQIIEKFNDVEEIIEADEGGDDLGIKSPDLLSRYDRIKEMVWQLEAKNNEVPDSAKAV